MITYRIYKLYFDFKVNSNHIIYYPLIKYDIEVINILSKKLHERMA